MAEYISGVITSSVQGELSKLAIHLASNLDLNVENVTEAINSYSGTTAKKVKAPAPKKATVSPKKVAKKVEEEGDDDGEEEEKPKKAAPKSAPKKAAAKSKKPASDDEEEEDKPKKAVPKKAVPKSKKPVSDDEEEEDEAPKKATPKKAVSAPKKNVTALVKKVIKQEEVPLAKVGKFSIVPKLRIIIDPKSKEAYGILDDDNETINPLDVSSKRYCETQNIPVRDVDGEIEEVAVEDPSEDEEEGEEEDE